jgi:uncharacterized CHY-type Zn-finger protein
MGKYKCYKCGNEYETSDIRFTGSNKYSCVYCLGVKQRQITPVHEVKKQDTSKEEMLTFHCGACNYSFRRKKGFVFTSCPYCNKEGTVIMKESNDASKLIKESSEKKFDF